MKKFSHRGVAKAELHRTTDHARGRRVWLRLEALETRLAPAGVVPLDQSILAITAAANQNPANAGNLPGGRNGPGGDLPPPPGVRTATGETTVPGYPDTIKLSYKITAQKVPGTARDLQFLLDATNNNDVQIDFVACAMLNLNSVLGMVGMPRFYADLVNDQWQITQSGSVTRTHNYHFGCVPTWVSPHSSTEVFNTKGTLSVDFARTDLISVYWDVLQSFPITVPPELVGADKWLVPRDSTVHPNAVNNWASNGGAINLGSRGSGPGTVESEPVLWSAGNWVTMGFPDYYPAELVGSLRNVPPRASFALTLPDRPDPIVFKAPPEGGEVDIDVPFVIPPEPDALMGLIMKTAKDASVPEGAAVHFDATVFARKGNPAYEPGEQMYGIAAHFIQDTIPPDIVDYQATVRPDGAVDFRVEATHSFTEYLTRAAAASLTVSVDGGKDQVVSMDFDDPAIIDGVTRFAEELGPFPPGATVAYRMTVADELGNLATIDGMIVIPSDFTVKKLQSSLDLSGEVVGAVVQPPGLGSLYTGSISTGVNFNAGTIAFVGGMTHPVAGISGQWQPLRDGSVGTKDANYDGLISFLGTGYAAIRDPEASIATDSLLALTSLGGGRYEFPSTHTLIITRGSSAYRHPRAGFGSIDLGGSAAEN